MMKKPSLLLLVLACCFATTTLAQRVEIILDGSGSMWGEVGNKTKIDAAKRATKNLVNNIQLPKDSSIGLTVYGHRTKGDCADIERFSAVPYSDRSRLLPTIEGISPKGKTPIADALSTVGESLKTGEGKTSIVLVSDGIESCGKDPCQVAQQLRDEYGIDVTIHVVGFDVKEGQEQEQLQCIARAGGGQFQVAKDAAQLARAFEKVEAQIVKGEPKAEPEPINVAAASNGGRVVLFSSAYSDRHADKLIDEAQSYWMSSSAAPQSIVLGFTEDRRARIVDLLINPYNAQNQRRWAKDVEVFVSDDSPYEGFRRVGAMTLDPVGTEQLVTFEPAVTGRYMKLNFMTNHGDGSHIAAGEVMLMGHLLEPDGHPGLPKNLAGAANGITVYKATSEYSNWKATNLIDGTQAYWMSNGASAQDVTLLLPGTAPQPVAAVAINPHNGQGFTRWAKDIEVLASTKSSYKGYVSLGTIELKPVGEYQVLRLGQPAQARYLRIRFLSNHGDGSHIAAGEVVVLGE